jgi:hypothetical protein
LTDLLRSFTSIYQLLPIYPSYDSGDGKLVRVGESVGIPNIDPIRAASALAFHHGIQEAVESNVTREAYVRDRYRIYPIVGTFQPTLQAAKLVSGKVVTSTVYPGPNSQFAYDGDGTVPRVSATPIEDRKESNPVFVAELHGSLQNTRMSLVQLEGLLAPRAPSTIFRDLELPRVALVVDDLFSSSEPVQMNVQCEDDELAIDAVLVDSVSGAEVARQVIPPQPGATRNAIFQKLAAGTYRVTVGAQGRSQRVSDVFIVVD